jgi:TIR domain
LRCGKARGFYAFEEWWQRIEALIARADTVVFVLSPDAVASDVAQREVAFAASLNKRFAPIVCRRVDDKEVPEVLRRPESFARCHGAPACPDGRRPKRR